MNVKRLQERIIELLSSSPRTIQHLLHSLRIPERTLRYHLAVLRRGGTLRETFSFSDRRRKLLSIFNNLEGRI